MSVDVKFYRFGLGNDRVTRRRQIKGRVTFYREYGLLGFDSQ